jgi:hypothetical protein
VILTGAPFTFTVAVAGDPQPVLYVIVAAPDDTPVTTPVAAFTLAVATLDVDQLPPVTASDNVVDALAHTVVPPVIAEGPELPTVTLDVILQ